MVTDDVVWMHNDFLSSDITPPAGENVAFGGVKPKKICPIFLWLYHVHKKYILQINWSKTAIPALSSGPSNLPEPIWGRHHQLDDQYFIWLGN